MNNLSHKQSCKSKLFFFVYINHYYLIFLAQFKINYHLCTSYQSETKKYNMKLSPALEKRYTGEHFTAPDAQRLAEFIAWGPVVFQVSRLMMKFGILDMLLD